MRVIYPKSMLKKASKKKAQKVDKNEPKSLITVHNVPEWSDLQIGDAKEHVGPFLEYMKNHHEDKNPVFTSKLLVAMDQSDANQQQAIEALRNVGSVISFTDLLALLGPAVEYALALINDKDSRSPENIERFVISLVMALAEATNEFGDEELIPLDKEFMEGITVTVRNIIFAFNKDFSKINFGQQISFAARLFKHFGGCCFGRSK